jgi:heavy metal sensor kinase
MYLRTRRQLTAEIDTYLDERIDRLVAQMELRDEEIAIDLKLVDPDPGLLWQISTASGRVLHRSGPVRGTILGERARDADPARPKGVTTFGDQEVGDDALWRIGVRRFVLSKPRRRIRIEWREPGSEADIVEMPPEDAASSPSFVLHAGVSLTKRDASLTELLLAMALLYPMALVVLGVGAWALVSRPLSIIDDIARTASQITPDRLAERIPVENPEDEIGRLAQVINGMLERVQQGFKREKQFASDASHELRTPLTALRGEMEVALRRPRAADEYRKVLTSSLAESERMTRILEGLLFLAEVDAGRSTHKTADTDLAFVLRRSVERIEERNPGVRIDVDTLKRASMVVRGSRDLLERLFMNLLENGIRHGAPPFAVTLKVSPQSVAVAVSDSGQGIAPQHLPRVFDRFYRENKDRSRASGGAGLGLAICKWIAESHGGTITARNDERGGAVFIVELPLSERTTQ